MTKEPWNKHIPGDPMPCKCWDSVVEAISPSGASGVNLAGFWDWGKSVYTYCEITDWRFIERKGEDVI